MRLIIGVDMGGTKCSVVLGRITGAGEPEILKKVKFATGIDISPNEIISEIQAAIDSFGDCGAEVIGISCGGPLDSKKGVILSPPNLPLWDNIPICKILSESYGIPAYLQNDADACALAEWKFGAGKGTKNMIFLTFGTGLGAGLILNGHLYTGACGMAGEIGHIRMSEQGPVGYGKVGSFEGFCSGAGIGQLGYDMGLEAYQQNKSVPFFEFGNPDACTAKTIADAADAGDKTAINVYKTSGEYLGRGLSVLIDLLNPEAIIIGSIFVRSYNLLWAHTKNVIERETLILSKNACSVLPAKLGESLGDYAAIAVGAIGIEEARE